MTGSQESNNATTNDDLAKLLVRWYRMFGGAIIAFLSVGVSVGMGYAAIKNDIGQLQAGQIQMRSDSQALSIALQNLNVTLKGIDTHISDSDRRVGRLEERVFGK